MKDYMDKNFPGWHREFAGFLDLGLDKENDIRAYASEGWGSH